MSCCCCEEKRIYISEKAPKAIGPYSPAVKGNGLVFISGQLGFDPATGLIVEGGVEAETRQALTNLKNLLEAAGTNLDNVMKTTVFLRDINDFAKMNAVYAEFFVVNPPARSAVQVAALPRAAAVEIEAVAMEGCQCDCGCGCGCDCEEEDED
ncbi:MAG: RidA family protein [Anaerolineae bacterium]|nr:RidA family protein [Anaerolineae bacterium]